MPPPSPVAAPGPGGTPVRSGAVVGTYHRAAAGTAPAVLVLGGSEGGLSHHVDRQAQGLAAAGWHALALSYWGGPGQPEVMTGLPLETFDAAVAWLADRPEVDATRLGLLGSSKGAEAALLLATWTPVRAVVAVAPSCVVWQGYDPAAAVPRSTWSRGGADVPFLPYDVPLAELARYPDAVIEVERVPGDVLAVCGDEDTVWPSAEMAARLATRVRERGGPRVTVLTFPGAGHLVGGPPTPATDPGHPFLGALGGTVAANAAAQRQSWRATLEHLAAAFARPGPPAAGHDPWQRAQRPNTSRT